MTDVAKALARLRQDHAQVVAYYDDHTDHDPRCAWCADLALVAQALAERAARMFPVLHAQVANGPMAVPWDWVARHEGQMLKNHDQSAERLASRGGLDACELWSVIHGTPYGECPPLPDALQWLRTEPWKSGTLTAQLADARREAIEACVAVIASLPCACECCGRPDGTCQAYAHGDALRALLPGTVIRPATPADEVFHP